MKTKYIVIIIAIGVTLGLIGYLIGVKFAGKTSSTKTTQNTEQKNYSGPVNNDEVLAELKAQLEKKPNDWLVNARIGDAYFDMGRFDRTKFSEAAKYYEKAIKLNPKDTNLYNNMGLVHHYLGNSLEGLKYVDEGIKIDPYYQRIYLTKGFILATGLGKREDAVKAWEKAKGIDPKSTVGEAANDYLNEFKR